MPTDASAQRLRVGAELRRLREAANLSGEQVASALEWSQPKVSRIEQTLWDHRENVDLVYCELSEYVKELEARLPIPAAVAQGAG